VLVGRVVSIVLGVVINGFLARLLTPSEYGAYFTSFTLVIVGAIVAQLGLDRAVVRLVSASIGTDLPGRARQAIRRILWIGSIAAVGMGAALAFGLGPWLADNVFHSALLRAAMPITGGWLAATAIQSLFVETYRGLQDFRRAVLFDAMLVDVLWASMFGALYVAGARVGLNTIIALSAGATVLIMAVGGAILSPRIRGIDGDGDLDRGEILQIAWPSVITNTAIYFLGTGVDLLVLAAFWPQRYVAVYGAATRLVTLVATPLWIVRGVMTPLIAELHAQGKTEELERSSRAAAALAGIPSLLVLGIFLLFGGSILGAYQGPFYRQGAAVLAILSFGRMVAVWAGPCAATLMMTGYQRVMMYVTVSTGVLSVALGIVFAQRFGRIGVAWSTSAVIILQNAAMLLLAKRLVGVWTHVEFSPRRLHRFFSKRRLAALAGGDPS
jgi:O-antigen/teichoic acid export membrane protein